MNHTYKIQYDFNHKIGDFTRDEIKESKKVGTDALIVHSILFPEDGSYSHNFFSIDGRTGESLDSIEEFKAWSMMAMSLKDRGDLHEWQQVIVETVCDMVREVLTRKRE